MNAIRNRHRSQRGFTLVELMVAITIALFLLGGLFATFQSTRNAYTQQAALAQLQDDQRLAMTLIAGVVESAGYYPNPALNNQATFMPSGGSWTAVGQAIVGTSNAAAPGDTITVRYGAASGDNVYDCRGSQNATGAAVTMTNTFKIAKDATTGIYWLVCNNGVADYQLISNVTNMQIVYGVHLGATTGSCTDTYQTSAQMVATPANWALVCSVRVTLTFVNTVNPNAAAIPVTRTVALMLMAGVNS